MVFELTFWLFDLISHFFFTKKGEKNVLAFKNSLISRYL